MTVSWLCRPVSGQDRGMTIFFPPIIVIIGPVPPGQDQSSASLCSVLTRHLSPSPGAWAASLDPAYHCQVIVGLINFAVRKISQPKQGCYVRASAIRLHHLPELKTVRGAGKPVPIWAEVTWAWLENLF